MNPNIKRYENLKVSIFLFSHKKIQQNLLYLMSKYVHILALYDLITWY